MTKKEYPLGMSISQIIINTNLGIKMKYFSKEKNQLLLKCCFYK